MAQTFVKPTDKAIKSYYEQLAAAEGQDARHEGNVRQAFQYLLSETAKAKDWTLVTEQSERTGSKGIRYDGVLRDQYKLPHGHWEAKDSRDDLTTEIRRKIESGYDLRNIVFENTREAALFQEGREVLRVNLRQPDELARLLNEFYSFDMPPFRKFEEAVESFKGEIPHIAKELYNRVRYAHETNTRFEDAFTSFYDVCATALNPNISIAAVDEMLIQHMLTERLIVRVFDMEKFDHQNVIAAEIGKVIDALTSKHFNYREFLGSLDRFYDAIERAADELATFTEKQRFLNTVYERFFQGYSVKVADTHGIVYTPQEIVDFMCAAVEEVLHDEFGLNLGDPGVNIVDPCTGTGSFIVHLMRRAAERNRRNFRQFYRDQLFANEVMLLPYYVASLNIEHAYHELMGEYEPFEGICFVDTLELAEGAQKRMSFMTAKNTARVERQKKSPITVVIGNPPYNVGQLNENDNNKNRKYEVIDKEVKNTYAKDSKATLKMQLYDPYVKFFRWATNRLGDRDGIVCFVSNNSFVDQIAFDGMRKHLMQDFTRIYHLDLHGNVRKNAKLSGTTHNVFGIQVGVGITVAVRSKKHTERKLFYFRLPEFARKEEKLAFLEKHVELEGRHNALNTIPWQDLQPDGKNTWLVAEHGDEFKGFLSIGGKEARGAKSQEVEAIFKLFSTGVSTARDAVVYDFNRTTLSKRVQQFVEDYNAEVDRYRRSGNKGKTDEFVHYDKIKWSQTLKLNLQRGNYAEFAESKIRIGLYRPFGKQYLFFDRILNDRQQSLPHIFPTFAAEQENRVIVTSDIAYRANTFNALMTNCIPDLHLCASVDAHQCFPFYVYEGDNHDTRRENITDWALCQFREHYHDQTISKWDIFYYVYGQLHAPAYRQKYADNLKKELPRLPYAPDFWVVSKAGKALADLHLNYETVEPYPLLWVEKQKPVSYRVEKMKFTQPQKGAETPYSVYAALEVNPTLTLTGIPAEAFDYRLGNRSALEWVVDQYQTSTDKRSGITSDPNRSDETEYIVRLVERVTRVSVETVKIVAGLTM